MTRDPFKLRRRILPLLALAVLIPASQVLADGEDADDFKAASQRTYQRLATELRGVNLYRSETADFNFLYLYGYNKEKISKRFPVTRTKGARDPSLNPVLKFDVARMDIRLHRLSSPDSSYDYLKPKAFYSHHKNETKQGEAMWWNGNKVVAKPYSYSMTAELKDEEFAGLAGSIYLQRITGRQARDNEALDPPQPWPPPRSANGGQGNIFSEAFLLVNFSEEVVKADRIKQAQVYFEYPLGDASYRDVVIVSISIFNPDNLQPEVPLIDERTLVQASDIVSRIVQKEFAGVAPITHGSGRTTGTPAKGTHIADPETVAAVSAAIAAVLIAAGIAAQIANAIAAALAQAVQSGVELTSEEISDAVGEGLKRAEPVPAVDGQPSLPPMGPDLYDKEGKPFARNEQGQYWAPDRNAHWVWMGEDDAREASAALRGERGAREAEIRNHDRQTEAMMEQWRNDTQDRYAAERAREAAGKARLQATRDRIEAEVDDAIDQEATPPEMGDTATPGIDNTGIGWGVNLAKEFVLGSAKDSVDLVVNTPGAIVDAIGSAAESAGKLLANPENWRIAAEAAFDTAKDLTAPLTGDTEQLTHAAGNIADSGITVGKIAGHLAEKAWEDPAGAAVSVGHTLLGVDNWEKAIDPDVPVTERIGRALWGVVDTGGVLIGAGELAAKSAAKIGEWIRVADSAADAFKGTKALDAAANASRAVETAEELAKSIDSAADAAKAVDAASDVSKGVEAAEAAGGMAETTSSLDSAGRETIDEMRQRLANQKRGPVLTPEGAAARRDGIPNMATDPVGYVRELPTGAFVDRNLAIGSGYTGHQIDDMARFAKGEDVIVGTRSTNIDSMRHIRDGEAVPKPITIKSKTINEADTYLGMGAEDKGLVGYFRPNEPDPAKVPPELWKEVEKRYQSRIAEYAEHRNTVTKYVSEGKMVERDGKLHAVIRNADGSTELKPFAGDIDGVYFKDAKTGEIIPPGERYDRLKAAWTGNVDEYNKSLAAKNAATGTEVAPVPNYWKRSGAPGQHGVETNLVADVTALHTPGTPEYDKALEKATELHEKLAANHYKDGGETVMEMRPDGHLRRGIRFTEDAPLPNTMPMS